MLFRKDIDHSCSICAHACELDGNDMLCRKYGVVNKAYKCRKFRYDPYKRIPSRSPVLPSVDENSLSLDQKS